VNEAAIVAVGLAAAEGFSSIDKEVPEVTNEATPEAGNDSVGSRTIPNVESQPEHEVDVTAPEAENTLTDIDTSLPDDPIPAPLPLETESSLIRTELVAEIETAPTATTNNVPVDTEVQPDPSSSATVPNAPKDTEKVESQVDEPISESNSESNIVQHINAADAEFEDHLEDVPALNTKESENAVQLEAEVDFVAPAEEGSSTIVQAEDLLPKIESEAIPILEDLTASVTNVEDQIIAPVDVRSEHAALAGTSSTDKPAEVILPPNVEESLLEESPETLTPPVEPSYKSSDNEIVGVSVLPIFY
jgi:hypothetical protein